LIDYYRKTDKDKTTWIDLIRKNFSFAVSAVTKYEIYSGAAAGQIEFWDKIFELIEVLPLDETSIDTAVAINAALKRKRKQIDIADLFIGATAVANKLPIATLNKRHFERIDELQLVQ